MCKWLSQYMVGATLLHSNITKARGCSFFCKKSLLIPLQLSSGLAVASNSLHVYIHARLSNVASYIQEKKRRRKEGNGMKGRDGKKR